MRTTHNIDYGKLARYCDLSSIRPWIDNLDTDRLEILNVSSGNRRPVRSSDGRYLSIKLAYGAANSISGVNNRSICYRRATVECQDASSKIFIEYSINGCCQSLSASSIFKPGNTISDFRLADRSREKLISGKSINPGHHALIWHRAQKLRDDICVQEYHRKSGAGRMASLGGMFKSTPSPTANRARTALARLGDLGVDTDSATRRMSRASSSIDRLCSAALILRRALSPSSRFRIVMLAMECPPSMMRY